MCIPSAAPQGAGDPDNRRPSRLPWHSVPIIEPGRRVTWGGREYVVLPWGDEPSFDLACGGGSIEPNPNLELAANERDLVEGKKVHKF